MTTEWQPIEGAPRDGTRLLLWGPHYGEPAIGGWCVSKAPLAFEGWSPGWQTVSGYDAGYEAMSEPTHWMRLPEPPA